MGRIRRALHRDESGFAMVMTVILLAVMGTLMAVVMSVSIHTNFATGRNKSWVQSLHVAEAGVEEAISKLQATNGTYTGTFAGEINEGAYSVTVAALSRKRFQIDATGTVSAGTGLSAVRKLRVTMAPPASFKNALFSYTTVATKGGDVITGDIWANQNVILEQGNIITGSVNAATGYIQVKNGTTISGDAWSGGFNPANSNAIFLENNAIVLGIGKASVTAPTDPITCGGENAAHYKVQLDGGASIGGNLTTWGTKNGPGTVGGTILNNTCTSAPPTEPMPVFTFAASNYDAATLHQYGTPESSSATAVSDVQSYIDAHKESLSGTFFVNQTAPVSQDVRIDLTSVTITGDTTIVTNTPIFTNGTTDSGSDIIVTLVSSYQPPTGSSCDVQQDKSECAIHLKNNFQTAGNTAVLVYSPFGPVAVKNNQIQYGAIYADNIQIKNNQSMTYDARVDRVVGFGDETYVVQTWLELKA